MLPPSYNPITEEKLWQKDPEFEGSLDYIAEEGRIRTSEHFPKAQGSTPERNQDCLSN